MEEIVVDDELKMSFKWGEDESSGQGPLDVLLQLIAKSKVEIMDVELSVITEQFLEYIQNMEKVDMDLSSSFVEEAARLIEIKSKKLLPKPEEDDENVEDDPEYLYKLRLYEYKVYKEKCEELAKMESNARFYKKPDDDASKYRIIIKDMQLEQLLDALSGIMYRVNKKEEKKTAKEIKKELFTVEMKVAQIKDALLLSDKVRFTDLFGGMATKEEVITTFMALLELLKLQIIKVEQNEAFCDIDITRADNRRLTEVLLWYGSGPASCMSRRPVFGSCERFENFIVSDKNLQKYEKT